MHCIHCGTELPDGAKFCTSCGQPVQAAPSAPVKEPNTEDLPAACESSEEPNQESSGTYTPLVNASEGYKAAEAQLPPSYSNPNYSSQDKTDYSVPAESRINGLAIGGFVCSLVIFPLGLGALCAIAGLILSILGLNTAKKLPGNKGHGLALAGTIISAVRIALLLILSVVILVLTLRGAGHVIHESIYNYWPY